jgi:hypothetical protein
MTKNSYSSDVGTQSNVRYEKYHLRSHIFPFDVPSGFDSYSKTPTVLLRNPRFPLAD